MYNSNSKFPLSLPRFVWFRFFILKYPSLKLISLFSYISVFFSDSVLGTISLFSSVICLIDGHIYSPSFIIIRVPMTPNAVFLLFISTPKFLMYILIAC